MVMWPPLLDERKYLFLFFLSMKPGFIFIKKIHIIYIYIYIYIKREREREEALWPHEKRRSDRVGICNKVQGLAKTFSYFLGMELFFI